MIIRRLERTELETLWTIDRREVHHYIYRVQNGELVRTPAYFDVPGWAPGQQETDTPLFYECFDRGGAFFGRFENDLLVGAAIVDSKKFGPTQDTVQLKWLYVSRDYRGKGIAVRLFEEAKTFARSKGAASLYVSATPTENTVRFYQKRGCRLAAPPDAELFALEPEDIHFVCPL